MEQYILAAHIRVTGGPEAAAQVRALNEQLGSLGQGGGGEQAGQNVAKGLSAARQEAGFFEKAVSQAQVALVRMATYQGISLIQQGISDAVTGWLDFDQAMTNSLSIQSGVTGAMRGQMESLAETISVHLGMAPKDVGNAFYYLASAGLDVNQQLADLPVVADFAKAGMMSLEKATETLLDSLAALGMKVDDPMKQAQNLQRLSDVLVEAANASQGTISQFGDSLTHKAAAAMTGLNIPLEEGVGLLEVFAERGLKGASAGERFSMVVRDMALKSQAHADVWQKLGITVFDANGHFRKLTEIMPEVDRALMPLSDQERVNTLKQMGFTMRDMNTIMGLLGTSGRLQYFVDDLENVGHVAKDVADKQMEALRAKLDQLKSFVMVMEIRGFEALQAAGEWLAHTFAPALNQIIEFLGHLAAGAAPVAEAFARLAVGAVAATLQAIAGALNAIFGAINAHPGLVEGLGTALASIAVVGAVSKLSELAVVIGSNLLGAIQNVSTPLLGFIGNLAAIQASEGTFAALKAGLMGVVELAGPLAVVGAAIGGIAIAFTTFRQGEQAVKDFRAELEKKYDTNTLDGMSAAIQVMTGQFNTFREDHHQSFLGMVNDTALWAESFGHAGENYYKTAGQMREYRKEIQEMMQDHARMQLGISLVGEAFGAITPNMDDLRQSMKNAGLDMKDVPVDQLRDSLSHLVDKTQTTNVTWNQLGADVQRVAKDFNIDIKAPPQEWVPRVAAILDKMYALHGVTKDLGGAAEGTGASLSSFEKAIGVLGDNAATTEDKLKAMKQIMDEINGVPLNLFEAQTAYGKSLQDLREKLQGLTVDFDSNTAAGTQQRELLSTAAEKAIKFAQAQAQASGNVQDGARFLQAYSDEIVNTLRQAGVAEPVIQEYLHQLGLTPEQITTVLTLTTSGIDEAKRQLNELGQQRTVDLYVQVHSADIPGQREYIENSAEGNIFDGRGMRAFAAGGFENHMAQIAPAGAMRLWAEPETGGEAYIPLADSKRDRSMAIWADVGRRFGLLDGRAGGTVNKSMAIALSAPVSVHLENAGGLDASEVASLVGAKVNEGVGQFAQRLLVELRSR